MSINLCSLCHLSLAEEAVAPHLSIVDFARLEQTERGQGIISSEHRDACWFASALAELKNFRFSKDTAGDEEDHALKKSSKQLLLGLVVTRAALIELVLGLRHVAVPEGSLIQVRDWRQARGLLAAVGRARTRSVDHTKEGGHVARLVAAVIKFGIDSTSSTLDAKSAAVSLPLEWPSGFKGPPSLEVALVRRGSQLFPSFSNQLPVAWTPAVASSQFLGFDIQTVSSVAKLLLPCVRLNRDGSHQNGVGLSTLVGASSSVDKALAEGVLCLVALRSPIPDRPGEFSRAMSANRGVHALHLDARW